MTRSVAPAAFLAALILPALLAGAAAPAAQGNGGRDPSLPPDLDSPVVHTLQPARSLRRLKAAPLYSFSQRDLDVYLKFLSHDQPDPIQRVIQLARKNIGQPYEIYLLGEGSYELYDPDPLYCLEKSDCVTFVEHTYAMALSHDWPSFFRTLQRIRYKDGKIGILTRNHESTADWTPNNAWLFEEITSKLGGGAKTRPMHVVWKPKDFFARWGIGQDLKDVTLESVYIPAAEVGSILSELKDGDVVQIVRGNSKVQYVGHFGIVAHGADGQVNMIHSAEPMVREQGILNFIEKNREKTLGMKFLRPRPQPQQIVDQQLALSAAK